MTITHQKVTNPHARAYAAFTQNAADHQLQILHEDGTFRQLRMAEPGTRMWSWDVVTWPGYLAIVGDIADGFTFSRTTDMLGFFSLPDHSRNYYTDGAPCIDFRYWAEKLAHEQRHSARAYSADELIRYVIEWTNDAVADGQITVTQAAELVDDARFHSEDEHTAIEWMSSEFSQHNQDWWDGTDLRDYTLQFGLACYAIDATVQAIRTQQEGSDEQL